jgi:hypothetical protein
MHWWRARFRFAEGCPSAWTTPRSRPSTPGARMERPVRRGEGRESCGERVAPAVGVACTACRVSSTAVGAGCRPSVDRATSPATSADAQRPGREREGLARARGRRVARARNPSARERKPVRDAGRRAGARRGGRRRRRSGHDRRRRGRDRRRPSRRRAARARASTSRSPPSATRARSSASRFRRDGPRTLLARSAHCRDSDRAAIGALGLAQDSAWAHEAGATTRPPPGGAAGGWYVRDHP